MAYSTWSERQGKQEPILHHKHPTSLVLFDQAEVMREVADQVLPGTCICQVSGYSPVQYPANGGSKLMGIVAPCLESIRIPKTGSVWSVSACRCQRSISNTLRPRPKFGRQIDIPLPLHGTKGMGMEGHEGSDCQMGAAGFIFYLFLTMTKLVGGLEHFLFSHSVGNDHPNWLIFFRGVSIPHTRISMNIVDVLIFWMNLWINIQWHDLDQSWFGSIMIWINLWINILSNPVDQSYLYWLKDKRKVCRCWTQVWDHGFQWIPCDKSDEKAPWKDPVRKIHLIRIVSHEKSPSKSIQYH